MNLPKIFLSKDDPRYWHEYWKKNRVLPPRDPYLYYGRLISTKKVDKYFDKMERKYKWEQRLEGAENFIQNILNRITKAFNNINRK